LSFNKEGSTGKFVGENLLSALISLPVMPHPEAPARHFPFWYEFLNSASDKLLFYFFGSANRIT